MGNGYGIEKIMQLLPHRYPFLLVDRVLEVEPGVCIKACKNVTVNEPYFQGHFPENPIMPGVMVLEAMVQAGALLMCETLTSDLHGRVCFSGVDKVRFRAPVVPGDQLIFEVRILKQRQRVVKIYGETFVNGRRVAEAEIMAVIGG